MNTIENIAELDYEAVQSEKRDKLNARLQVWSLLIALVGGFGLASVQSNSISYVVALFPLLAACIARYAAHSESVLDQIKDYLLIVEMHNEFKGYESFNGSRIRHSKGGHKKALCHALVLTEVLATVAVTIRLFSDHLFIVAILVILIELIAISKTASFLHE